MSAPTPNDPSEGNLFERSDFLDDLDRVIDGQPNQKTSEPTPTSPEPAQPSESITEPVADSTSAPRPPVPASGPEPTGGGKGVMGMIGSAVLILIVAMVVKGIKRAAVEVARDDGPKRQQQVAPAPQLDPEAKAAFARLLNRPPATVRTPPTPPKTVPALKPWVPAPPGASPLDKLKPEDIPAKLRTANPPNELVAVFESDAKRTWASELGPEVVTGQGRLLDRRPVPPDGAKTRIAVEKDGTITCYDLAGGQIEQAVEVEADEHLARLSLGCDRLYVCDGTDVRRMNLSNPDGEGEALKGLGGSTSHIAQFELFDQDRLLILRREDGHVFRGRIVRSAVAELTDLGDEKTGDDIAVSPDRKLLVITSKGRKALSFIEIDGDKVNQWTMNLKIRPVRAVVHPGRKFVAVVDSTNGIYVLEAASAKLLGSLQSKLPPRSLVFADDGRHLVIHDDSGKTYVARYDRIGQPPVPTSEVGGK